MGGLDFLVKEQSGFSQNKEKVLQSPRCLAGKTSYVTALTIFLENNFECLGCLKLHTFGRRNMLIKLKQFFKNCFIL